MAILGLAHTSFMPEANRLVQVYSALVVGKYPQVNAVQVHFIKPKSDQYSQSISAQASVPQLGQTNEQAYLGTSVSPIDAVKATTAYMAALKLNGETSGCGILEHVFVPRRLLLLREWYSIPKVLQYNGIIEPTYIVGQILALNSPKRDKVPFDHGSQPLFQPKQPQVKRRAPSEAPNGLDRPSIRPG
jgi:hypothetical protein